MPFAYRGISHQQQGQLRVPVLAQSHALQEQPVISRMRVLTVLWDIFHQLEQVAKFARQGSIPTLVVLLHARFARPGVIPTQVLHLARLVLPALTQLLMACQFVHRVP